MEYTIRQYQPGDEEGIVQLLVKIFEGWPNFDLQCTPLDHLRWKHQARPYNLNSSAVAISNNEIIGTSLGYPLKIKIGEKCIIGYFDGDNAVHPDFRRMGISKKMYDLQEELTKEKGIYFNIWESGNPILIKYGLKNYNLFPFPLTYYVRINDVNLHLRMISVERAWILKTGFHIATLLNNVGIIFSRSDSYKKDLQISETASFDDRINELWDKTKNNYGFIVERTRDYLNWRYCDPRGGNYDVRCAEEDGRILGYIVLRINRIRDEYPVGHIVDLLTLPERYDVVDALVSDAVKFLDSQSVNLIRYLGVKHRPNERILNKHGFLDTRMKQYVFYESLDSIDILTNVKATSSKQAHFCYGDLDYI